MRAVSRFPRFISWALSHVPLWLPAADASADAGDDGDGDAGDGDGGAAPDSEVERLAKANAKLQEDLRAAKAAARKADAAKRAQAAKDENKLQEELTRTADELAKANERLEAIEQATKNRVEAKISKLPKDVQDEIELIRDSVAIDKLEAFVDKRAATTASSSSDGDDKAKGSAGGGANGVKPKVTRPVGVHNADVRKVGHQIHPETKETLLDLSARDHHFKVAERLGYTESDGKFGWGRTEDQRETTANFIGLLDSIKAKPVGGDDPDALYERMLKK